MMNETSEWVNETTPSSNSDNDIGQSVFFLASIFIGSLGILGNGLVILICFRYPLQGITNILICNQSLIDFLSSVLFLIMYTNVYDRNNLPSSPIAAQLICFIWVSEYPLWALGVSSTVNLEYITIERYFAVFHTLKHKSKFTPYRAKLCALIPWVYGLLHELPWAFSHQEREPGICSTQWQSDGLRFAVAIIAPLDHYIIPMLLFCFVYTKIFFKIRKTDLISSSSNTREFKVKRASHRIIKTMCLVSTIYLICWGPNEGLYFYHNMGGIFEYWGAFHYYTAVSALFNMCVNPIIYMLHWKDFRTRAWQLLGVFSKETEQSAHVSDTRETNLA